MNPVQLRPFTVYIPDHELIASVSTIIMNKVGLHMHHVINNEGQLVHQDYQLPDEPLRLATDIEKAAFKLVKTLNDFYKADLT